MVNKKHTTQNSSKLWQQSQGRKTSSIGAFSETNSNGGAFSDRKGSVGSRGSASGMKVKGFLDRNYYTIKDTKKIEMEKAKQRYDNFEMDKRRKEAAMWAGIPATKPGKSNRPGSQNS